MRMIFTTGAKEDLREPRAYLWLLNAKGLANFVAALERVISLASDNPRIGRPTPRVDLREIVELNTDL